MASMGKSAAKRRSTPARASSRSRGKQQVLQLPEGSVGGSLRRDLLLMALTSLALYFALAVYTPTLVRPAGPVIHGSLYAVLGAGMWLLPLAALISPVLLTANPHWRGLLLRGLAWSLTLSVLATLAGGLWPAQDWGGMAGGALASLGYRYTGAFYPVLVALICLLALIRLGFWSVLGPVLRGLVAGAAVTGEAAARLGSAVSEKAAEAHGRRREARTQAEAERLARQEAILAAELEAADSPDGSSAIIRDEDAVGRAVAPAKGRRRSAAMHAVTLEGTVDSDDPDFAAALDAAVLGGAGGPARLEEQDAGTAARATKKKRSAVEALLAEAEGADEPRVHANWPEHGGSAILAVGDHRPEAGATGKEGQLGLFTSTQAGYRLPDMELLRDAPTVAGEEEHLAPRAATIERTLASFNIEAKCVDAVVGPRVTRYELTIGPGINVSKIHALSDNLALELAVKAVRIEAPIPGKRAVGIEVPNAAPQLVTLRSILSAPLMQRSNHPLTVAIGRDIAGNPIIANLAKMPHLLVAGATGSGKSVCLNTLIVSLLMRNAPDTLRLILIDPKRVEMTNYEDAPHLACPVVCDVNQAQSALKWVVAEMDRRYRLFQARRARNIAAYNESAEPDERLPFIVVVVDELADLMMLAGQTVEKLIARITQLSRAVGIHLVIATQRPDVKVITGTIKANVPSRIAFAVVSQVDSRVILDGTGADKLLGGGDMLFSPIGENVPLRVQGCFLADDEIDRVVEHCRAQAKAQLDEAILRFGQSADGGHGTGSGPGGAYDVPKLELDGTIPDDPSSGDNPVADNSRDPLFAQAEAIVVDTGRASTSYLQRRLKIGYNRAARIMEELQEAGIVSEPDVRGDRKVL